MEDASSTAWLDAYIMGDESTCVVVSEQVFFYLDQMKLVKYCEPWVLSTKKKRISKMKKKLKF